MKPIISLVVATVAVVFVAPVQAQINCDNWNTGDFFNAIEISDVTRCLQAGADPNARDENGLTPLHFAARYGTTEAVPILLDAGANPMARSLRGETPLHWVTTSEAVTALLQAGTNLEARNENGETPLHRATTSEAVTALLQAGANLEARNKYNGTPLHRAAELSNNPAVIKVLLDAGADTAARNAVGKTPWDLLQVNDTLKGSDAYWRLNDARFQSSDSGFRVAECGGSEPSSPSIVFKVDAAYSEEARQAKLQGTVVLNLVVQRDGTVGNVQVVQSLGLGLDEKAIEAVRQWRFNPGMCNGQAVDVESIIEVTFRLL